MIATETGSRMWSEACEMLERAERLHRQFFQPGLTAPHATSWEPPLDMFATSRDIWIIAALPGVTSEQLYVSIKADEITIAGSRPLPMPVRDASIHRLEIPYGCFERRLRLPAGRFELERSELANGCLVLRFTRRD